MKVFFEDVVYIIVEISWWLRLVGVVFDFDYILNVLFGDFLSYWAWGVAGIGVVCEVWLCEWWRCMWRGVLYG